MASFMRRAMVYLGLTDDEYDDYDQYEEPPPPMAGRPPVRPYAESPYAEGPEPVTAAIRPLSRELGPREYLAREQPTREHLARDQLGREPLGREPLGREPLGRDRQLRDRPTRDRPPRDQPTGVGAVTPRPSAVRPVPNDQPKVHVVAPGRFADAQEIGDKLRISQPVIVNLQVVDRELSRRMIDFCSGVTYALGGAMEKVADQVFLLTPTNVEVSPEERRQLSERGLYRSAP